MSVKPTISILYFACILTVHFNVLSAQELRGNQNIGKAISLHADTLQIIVDNHKMSMYVSGTGKYTVILEAGGASNHGCWRAIDKPLAKITRVISYDRPGYLKSEMCEKQRDAITVARELKEALQTAGFPPPYILVGWSLGGAFARVFCGLYPESTAGLVLIDPTPEDVYSRVEKEYPELMAEDSLYMKKLLASTNRPGERAENVVFDTSMYQARISDTKHAIPTSLLIAAYGKGYGDGEIDPNSPVNRLWAEELIKWAAKRPNLQYSVVKNSGHHIAKERPEIVLKAITDMIDKLKYQ